MLAQLGLSSPLRILYPTPDQLPLLVFGLHPSPLPIPSNADADAPPPPLPLVQIRLSPGAGHGLFALVPIRAFTPILFDHALLSLAPGQDLPELWEKYQLLSADEKASFDALTHPPARDEKGSVGRNSVEVVKSKLVSRGYPVSAAAAMAQCSARFTANAFKTAQFAPAPASVRHRQHQHHRRPKQPWAHALFPLVARVNHSCVPNAHAHFRPAAGAEVVCALRDIDPGEEITIAYFDLTMAKRDRVLRAEAWGFTCACPACGVRQGWEGHEESLAVVRTGRNAVIGAVGASDGVLADRSRTLNDVRRAVDVALDPERTWLRAALPTLYTHMAALLTEIGRPRLEVDGAVEQAKMWEVRISNRNLA